MIRRIVSILLSRSEICFFFSVMVKPHGVSQEKRITPESDGLTSEEIHLNILEMEFLLVSRLLLRTRTSLREEHCREDFGFTSATIRHVPDLEIVDGDGRKIQPVLSKDEHGEVFELRNVPHGVESSRSPEQNDDVPLGDELRAHHRAPPDPERFREELLRVTREAVPPGRVESVDELEVILRQ